MEMVKGDLRSVDFSHVSSVLELAGGGEGHGRVQAPGIDVMRSFEWLRMTPLPAPGLEERNYRVPAPVPGAVEIPGGDSVICLELLEKMETSGRGIYVYTVEMGFIDWCRVPAPLQLRNWRPGDQYKPLGHTGEEKIKTLFQEARIPLWERRHWPVLVAGDSIIWSRQFGPAAQYAATPESSPVLRVREIGIGAKADGVYISGKAGTEVS
jgi:tRNA(Ile)-lysidine synthase